MLDRIEGAISVIAGVLLMCLALLTLGDVIGRNIFHQPLAGTTELTELGLVGITFLLYPQIALRRHHIVIDLFDGVAPQWLKAVQNVLAGVLGALFFAALSWRMVVQGGRVSSYGDITTYLHIPLGPAYYFMAVLSALTAIAFILTIFIAPRDAKREGHAPSLGIE
ncbi:TRAP-type C4-dicarboxylate transport system permease small subunit [Mesorhizobium sp. J18]|uniref:TRAP transporter small permease n=1 Tax=Mesorhizobium sp. J18 TaxID=935263 RepID=UPI00119A29E7|nr:TRAP transporter small permease [Mesorhizobium sp. J18]TWG92799.1 TRAP-type C4-dicarboxylate transport system permease small subunit [Mesorhizobium sp. J18]